MRFSTKTVFNHHRVILGDRIVIKINDGLHCGMVSHIDDRDVITILLPGGVRLIRPDNFRPIYYESKLRTLPDECWTLAFRIIVEGI
jgi:hypothetical protein